MNDDNQLPWGPGRGGATPLIGLEWSQEEDRHLAQYYADQGGKRFCGGPATLLRALRDDSGNTDLLEFMVLGKILQWYLPSRAGGKRFAGPGLFLNSAQLASELGQTQRQVQGAARKLEASGLIIRKRWGRTGVLTRINWKVLKPKMDAAIEDIAREEEERKQGQLNSYNELSQENSEKVNENSKESPHAGALDTNVSKNPELPTGNSERQSYLQGTLNNPELPTGNSHIHTYIVYIGTNYGRDAPARKPLFCLDKDNTSSPLREPGVFSNLQEVFPIPDYIPETTINPMDLDFVHSDNRPNGNPLSLLAREEFYGDFSRDLNQLISLTYHPGEFYGNLSDVTTRLNHKISTGGHIDMWVGVGEYVLARLGAHWFDPKVIRVLDGNDRIHENICQGLHGNPYLRLWVRDHAPWFDLKKYGVDPTDVDKESGLLMARDHDARARFSTKWRRHHFNLA